MTINQSIYSMEWSNWGKKYIGELKFEKQAKGEGEGHFLLRMQARRFELTARTNRALRSADIGK